MNNQTDLRNKKLLILGGNPETGSLVETANRLGIFTIVVDPVKNSPAKKFANKSYNVDGFDIKNLLKICLSEDIDGVLVGVADILMKPYFQLCKTLKLPCYVNKINVDAFTQKDSFIKICEEYGIQTIPYFKSDKIIKNDEFSYPVMVKPVDNGGGVGMTICYNRNDFLIGTKNALKHSKKRNI